MIPKIIHYCWFGNNPLPHLVKKCIKSWIKFCPDYQIIEWNESNYNVNSITYTQQAYKEKKYAFVSDYARFDILYNYGGIYLDTDVELVKSLDDLLNNKSFMGFESDDAVAPGLIIGSEKNSNIIREIKDNYLSKLFYYPDGTTNLTTVVRYTTDILITHGLILNGEFQCLEGIVIYPKNFFNPTDIKFGKYVINKNTYSIHHFSGSWLTIREQKKRKRVILVQTLIGTNNYLKLSKIKQKLFGRKK